jgi:predicted nuclease with TOPRIM domain
LTAQQGGPPRDSERRRQTELREVLDELLDHVRELANRARDMESSELEFAQERLEWLADEIWRTVTGPGDTS